MVQGNNVNIVHVNAIQGLLDEVAKHIKEIDPDHKGPNRRAARIIAKENAEECLKIFQDCDIHLLQQEYEDN